MILPKLPHLFLIASVTLCLTPIAVGSPPQVAGAKQVQGDRLVEGFSFLIKDLTVTIKVRTT